MSAHTIELVCPMLTLVGIGLDYLGRNYADVVKNKPMKSFSPESTIPTAFAFILMGLGLLAVLGAALGRHSSPGWMTGILVMVAVALSCVGGWAWVQTHNERVSFPRISGLIARCLSSHEKKIKPLAENLGLPIATAVCLIEMLAYIFGVLTD